MIHCNWLTLELSSELTCLSARFTTEVSSWAMKTPRQVVNSTSDLLSRLARCGTRCVVVAVMGTSAIRRLKARRNAQGRSQPPVSRQKRYGADRIIRAGAGACPVAYLGHARRSGNCRSGRAGGRSHACQYPLRAARRPGADRERACLFGWRLAANHQRPSRQADQRQAAWAREAGPSPLLPPRRTAYRADAGKHHGRGGHGPAPLSATIEPRGAIAARPHLLRPSGRTARRRVGGAALLAWACRSGR